MTDHDIEGAIAIRQFLSRPEPRNGACGCLGARKAEPLCPCAMKYVEIVNNNYYKISHNRSPEGITQSALFLGPVGGPYIVDSYGRILEKPEHKKTSAERIAEIREQLQ